LLSIASKLLVQKQPKLVVCPPSPHPYSMFRTMVDSGTTAHDGRDEYAGTLFMKIFCAEMSVAVDATRTKREGVCIVGAGVEDSY
jgi:hypothetical protein